MTKAGKRLEKSREQTREQKFLKTGPKSGQGEKMMLSRKRQQTPKREPGPKECRVKPKVGQAGERTHATRSDRGEGTFTREAPSRVKVGARRIRGDGKARRKAACGEKLQRSHC